MHQTQSRVRLVLLAGIALAASALQLPAAPATVSEPAPSTLQRRPGYRIGPGDVLQVMVAKEPDASVASTVVRSDGVVALPLVKEMQVGGLTPSELEQKLNAAYARYILEPEVSVIIKEIHSEKVYLIGAVKKEGPITLSSPLTVLQAIAEAGGLTDFAKRNKIYILRVEGDSHNRILFDYQAVVKGGRMDNNIVLQPGDTVVVPQ